MLLLAVGLAVFSTLVGTAMADAVHRESGPVIITLAATPFFASSLRRHE